MELAKSEIPDFGRATFASQIGYKLPPSVGAWGERVACGVGVPMKKVVKNDSFSRLYLLALINFQYGKNQLFFKKTGKSGSKNSPLCLFGPIFQVFWPKLTIKNPFQSFK